MGRNRNQQEWTISGHTRLTERLNSCRWLRRERWILPKHWQTVREGWHHGQDTQRCRSAFQCCMRRVRYVDLRQVPYHTSRPISPLRFSLSNLPTMFGVVVPIHIIRSIRPAAQQAVRARSWPLVVVGLELVRTSPAQYAYRHISAGYTLSGAQRAGGRKWA